MQIWIFVLSTLIFIFGILMLTDLSNYKYVITDHEGTNYTSYVDEQGQKYVNVYFKCTAELIYGKELHNITGGKVKKDSGYKAKNEGVFLDVYETRNGEQVFLKTLQANEYSENFYDLEYGWGIKVIPRLNKVKYIYPAWRIYIPVLLFVLTVPIMALSGYLSVTSIIEKIKSEKASVGYAE